jgi:hypothetical protein
MKKLIKNRRGNLPLSPLPLFVMLLLCITIVVHSYLYPTSFPINITTIPNGWDLIFWGIMTLGFIVVTINVVYSLYESLRYGGS